MTATVTKPTTLYEQSIRQALPGPLSLIKESAWMQNLRHQALSRFEILGLPTRRQETWRYVDLKPVLDLHFDHATAEETVTEQDIQPYLFLESRETTLVFVNGHYQPNLSNISGLPENIRLLAFDNQIKSVLASDINTETDAFVALNTALFQDAAVLWIPENTVITQPVHVLFYHKNSQPMPQMTHSRLLVVLENHAALTLVNSIIDSKNKTAPLLANCVTEFVLHENAMLNATYLQVGDRLLASTKATLQENAQLKLNTFALGGDFSRQSLQVTLQGEKAHAELNGLCVLTAEQQAYAHTIIDHAVPHCTTQQVYKGILAGHSRSEFDGTIVIRPGAQQSDASQLNQNLLLSEDARVITRPQLRIDADDVKCAHGATVGQLSEEELFYLRSRGLSASHARAILTFAFAQTVIEKVPLDSLRRELKDLVIRNLDKH